MAALRVNEIVVYLHCQRATANWWALYRAHGPASRFTIITPAIPGDLVEVACEDAEDAESLRDLLMERGIPRTALKVIA